jgi:glutamyl/glutaminyl-tRNA synthetase
LPLVLDPEGGKLSKRKGTVAAKDFLVQGYLPEAILNFLMLLGWSSPIKHEFGEKEREIFQSKGIYRIIRM